LIASAVTTTARRNRPPAKGFSQRAKQQPFGAFDKKMTSDEKKVLPTFAEIHINPPRTEANHGAPPRTFGTNRAF
jgi:hypothetical protein